MSMGVLSGVTIAFDLDGTLVDTGPDLVRALNVVLDEEGLPRPQAEEVLTLVGHGARVLIERASSLAGVQFSDVALDRLTARFVDVYAQDIAGASRPFPGLTEALGDLKDAGARFVVCTNKRTDLSVQLLDALALSTWFSAVVGADAVPQRKPHPGHFKTAIERIGGDWRRAIMVGDSAADVGTARGAGAPSVVVSFGYSDVPVTSLGADAIISHYGELYHACVRLAR